MTLAIEAARSTRRRISAMRGSTSARRRSRAWRGTGSELSAISPSPKVTFCRSERAEQRPQPKPRLRNTVSCASCDWIDETRFCLGAIGFLLRQLVGALLRLRWRRHGGRIIAS
jgi:hypothetical protein